MARINAGMIVNDSDNNRNTEFDKLQANISLLAKSPADTLLQVPSSLLAAARNCARLRQHLPSFDDRECGDHEGHVGTLSPQLRRNGCETHPTSCPLE